MINWQSVTANENAFSDQSLEFVQPNWDQSAPETRESIRLGTASYLPNPFLAGMPLTPQIGKETFRGREQSILTIRDLLSDPNQNHPILLLAPRRCGKTSLLKMLPAFLPESACVFLDLLDNPINSPKLFFEALTRRICEKTLDGRNCELPPFPERSPLEAALAQVDLLESWCSKKTILICIDEFEQLERLYSSGRQEMLSIMEFFHTIIQKHRKIRLLLSGITPFNELHRIWADHFANAHELRLGHLNHEACLDLLTKPHQEIPDGTIKIHVADKVYQRTNGQPYLSQMFGAMLIDHLNEEQRSQATLGDVRAVEEAMIYLAGPYFRYVTKAAPAYVQQIWPMLAENMENGHSPKLEKKAKHWLQSQCLLNGNEQLSVPILGHWIREEWKL